MDNPTDILKSHLAEIILLIGVFLISLLSFAMGYISAKEDNKQSLKIEQNQYVK